MADSTNFTGIDRTKTWGAIFDTIDENFKKADEMISTIGTRIRIEKYTATANQTLFTLTSEYNTARNCLAVYVNGSRQWLDSGFTETSTTSFTLVTPCQEGDRVVAVYNQYYTLSDVTNDEFNNVLTQIEANLVIANENAMNAKADGTKAQSYAVGGTSSRDGEDTDNAKYYASQAEASATAAAASAADAEGVTSFNGRQGVVTSKLGDYTTAQVTHDGVALDTVIQSLQQNQGGTYKPDYEFGVDDDGYVTFTKN